MINAADRINGFPSVWVRWVEQQVRSAVAYELGSVGPRKGPHLRRLPLTVEPHLGDREIFFRQLIAGFDVQSGQAVADPRIDYVTAAVLATPGVDILEPDLQMLLAWHLAEHHTAIAGSDADRNDLVDADHECFDPELLAAEMVASGLIAPAWQRCDNRSIDDNLDEPVRRVTSGRTRRTRWPEAQSQLALLFTA